MRNAQHYKLKQEGCFTNKFNNTEYERWSAGITGSQSPKTQWVVESFLGTSKKMPLERENISLSLVETREKQNRAGRRYVLEMMRMTRIRRHGKNALRVPRRPQTVSPCTSK
jgi:hypothetical protein